MRIATAKTAELGAGARRGDLLFQVRKEFPTNTEKPARAFLPHEALPGLGLGALASLAPVWLTDVNRGAAGVLLEIGLLFAAALWLTWWKERAVRTTLFLLCGAAAAEAVALAMHPGLAVFAGAWAPAGALLLAAVPSVVCGASLGIWAARRPAGLLLPVCALAAGCASALLLDSSFLAAALVLFASGAVLAAAAPRHSVWLGCEMISTSAMVAVMMFFARETGPGNMWPVVLPVDALILAPMGCIGVGVGVLLARLTRVGAASAGSAG